MARAQWVALQHEGALPRAEIKQLAQEVVWPGDGEAAQEDAGRARRKGAVNAAYLEDASGYRGEADRLLSRKARREIAEHPAQASRERIPVTVVGAGTGITGGRVAHGGWVLSVEKLKRIEVHPGRAVVGPAVLLRDLQAARGAHRPVLRARSHRDRDPSAAP